jgi:hypothetical protein
MDKRHSLCANLSFLQKLVLLLVFVLAVFPGLWADDSGKSDSGIPLFTWNLLWAGSWTKSFNLSKEEFSPELLFYNGTLTNRGELRIGLPRQSLDFRFQGINKLTLPAEDIGVLNPGLGLYFNGGGPVGNILGNSRLLYGVLDEYGLPARIRNVWAKSAPYAEYRKPIMSDLKTEPSATHTPETYLYLGLPQLGLFTGFATAQVDDEFNPAFGAGFETKFDKTTNLKIEGFYTQRILEAREPKAWFSTSPALPEREFHLLGVGTALDMKNLGLAVDLAYSDTFAWGRDIYGNAALRLGSKPWKFSFAVDGAGSRYVGRDGNAPGSGLRLAGRVERSWIRSGLFRFNTVFRSPGLGEDFNRGSLSVYFRPSAPRGKQVPLFRFARASLGLSRNAVNPLKTSDSLDVMAAFNFRTLRTVCTGSLDSMSVFDTKQNPFPLPIPPFFENFESAKISGEISWSIKSLQLRYKMGYTIRAEKDPIWDFSLNNSLKTGNIGRVSLKISSSDFPDKWEYTLSWRLAVSSR